MLFSQIALSIQHIGNNTFGSKQIEQILFGEDYEIPLGVDWYSAVQLPAPRRMVLELVGFPQYRKQRDQLFLGLGLVPSIFRRLNVSLILLLSISTRKFPLKIRSAPRSIDTALFSILVRRAQHAAETCDYGRGNVAFCEAIPLAVSLPAQWPIANR
jgi:hypothetical protein